MALMLADADLDAASVDGVQRILLERLVTPLFQPIVDLATGAVVGAEALARGPAGTPLERPDLLFAAAERAGQLGAMDLLCAERALECALAAPVRLPLLFVNAEPAVLDQPLSPHLLELLLGGLPFRTVLEYTERALSTVPAALLRIAGMSHRLGNGIALDDVGADPMSLAFLPFADPDVIKLDMHLLRHPAAASTARVSAAVTAAARRTGAKIIAEGIETSADIATARALGAHWGQGWHFGRPAPPADLSLPAISHDTGLRSPRPDLHLPSGSPWQVAAARRVRHVDRSAVGPALERMSAAVEDRDDTVVLGSYAADEDVAAWQPQIRRVTRRAVYTALLGPDGVGEPFPGEDCLLVMTADYAAALCRRPGGILHTEDRDTVAAVGRLLLQRRTAARP